MGILVMVGQFLLALSILVALHELGHLLTAKWFKMRVEQYSIGFPPKVWGFRRGETEYILGSIPLGGYVKISGMVDESLDTAKLTAPPQPWEFRAKPAWQRLIVMIGGVTVNFVTGILIFIFLLWVYGESYLPASRIDGIVAYPLAQEIGLKTGDRIVRINGQPFERFNDVKSAEVLLGSGSFYTVVRDGQEIEVKIPNDLVTRLQEKQGEFIDPFLHFSVKKVRPGYPAQKAGLLSGDQILQINDTPLHYYHELQSLLKAHKGEDISLVVLRKGSSQGVAPAGAELLPGDKVKLKASVTQEGLLGFEPSFEDKEQEFYSFGESIAKGSVNAFTVVFAQVQGFAKMFRGEISPLKSLSGPIEIAEMFGSVWDWQNFWALTGLLSMVLAFMNLLPIPALDGGHVVFLLYEMVSGSKPSDKFLETAQKVGMAFLLCLMVFVISKGIITKLF